jgi:hypothetical protein
MNVPKKPALRSQATATSRWSPIKAILRIALPVAVVGTVLCGLAVPADTAKSDAPAALQTSPGIDPAAMAALNKMGAYLRTLNAFQVIATASTDRVLDDGQVIQFNSKVDIVTARPNRLRIEVNDDDGHRFLYFDGKNFTIYGQVVNFYATVPASGTIAKLADDLADKYGIELPLFDLFYWGTNEAIVNKIKEAVDIGPSAVDGITCEQYAFRQAGADWQIWIELGQFPLPRKLVIRTLTDDAKPQHGETLAWNLAPSFSDNAFTFDPPAGATRITIAQAAQVKSQATPKK